MSFRLAAWPASEVALSRATANRSTVLPRCLAFLRRRASADRLPRLAFLTGAEVDSLGQGGREDELAGL